MTRSTRTSSNSRGFPPGIRSSRLAACPSRLSSNSPCRKAGFRSVPGKKLEERVNAGRSITHWFSPKDLDLLIVASPDFQKKSFRQSGVDIEIYHTRMPEKFIEGEVQQIASVVKFYTDRLGETNIPGGTVRHVYSPKRKGQGKAGTARPGLIVTSEGVTVESLGSDPHFSLFQPIAHEIAHFWWNFGAGQGDWINEASAEYFSAIAVQRISSETEFNSILEDYRKQVRELPADAPPLATVPFLNDDVGYVVRYFKGALMLDPCARLSVTRNSLPLAGNFSRPTEGNLSERLNSAAFGKRSSRAGESSLTYGSIPAAGCLASM